MFVCSPSLRRLRETEADEKEGRLWSEKGSETRGAKLEEPRGEKGGGKERAEPLGGTDGRVFQLLVRTRSRGGFHGIIKMFVDVDGEGCCERMEETQNEINVRAEARNQKC